MAREIERKFLVTGTAWKDGASGTLLRQGYLSTIKERTVRVRTEDHRAMLTIKGLTVGVSRLEFEYEIPLADAVHMLDALCERPLVEKTRYRIPVNGHTWEIDEFHGENEGLVVAEIELASADDTFDRPDWLGQEVSNDPRYFNANLIREPYQRWGMPKGSEGT
jgi:CYTH domain-containing protein